MWCCPHVVDESNNNSLIKPQLTHLHVSVELLHELLLLLLAYEHLLHVVPEVHVLEGGQLFPLQNKIQHRSDVEHTNSSWFN